MNDGREMTVALYFVAAGTWMHAAFGAFSVTPFASIFLGSVAIMLIVRSTCFDFFYKEKKQ